MTVAKKSIVIAGLPVHIYSERHLTEHKGPVAVMFFLHGRTGTAKGIEWIVEDMLKQVGQKRRCNDKSALDLIVVTFDQRNHGDRLVDAHANGAWKKGNNERHAIDMYAIQTGTAQDVSYLIDFLPSYLFPSGEREIAQWLVGGKSLGGHSTWIALTHEPRLSLAVPIIACPDYMKLITRRAQYSGVPLEPPYFTDSLRAYIARNDPARAPYTAGDASNPFWGKKVLVLSGGSDPLVPFAYSEEFVQGLNVGPDGVKKVVIQPGVQHECTPGMVKEMAEFVWAECLKSGKE
ncbi:alpha/beta hydrolase [Phanerochaete sordida]|uniref:Alpha/beta hydrolase n=1 Tax=Phanerochaete sordida TaxID=48140 RepID=A0A9P3LJC6_9APHY|nr:alpha/beta hydrolase [Phanerochaete sordida]